MALTSVLLAVTLFGIPLGILASRSVTSDERSEIERIALRAAIEVSPDAFTHGQPALPHNAEAEPVGLYNAEGRRIDGKGPSTLEPQLQNALRGTIAQATTDSALVVAVPLTRPAGPDEVSGVVRASSSLSEVRGQVRVDWLVLGLIGIGACLAATALAMAQSRRLAKPILRLERVATELGDGNLAARSSMSGVAEIDRAGAALNATAARLAGLIAREQAFSTQASHQLRTPLTGLRLQLEAAMQADAVSAPEALRGAMQSADRLSRTIDDVLHLARHPSAERGPIDLAVLLDDVAGRWSSMLSVHDRGLTVEVVDPPEVVASEAAIRQVLDVLLDNAYTHGRGRVTITARESGGALAVDVVDEGHAEALLPPPSDRLGLGLAQSTAVGQGGRLVQALDDQHTRMTLLVPAAHTGEPAH